MATIANETTEIVNSRHNGITLHCLWEALVNGSEEGDGFVNPNFKDLCIHIKGTFGGADSIAIEGTNDTAADASATWTALQDKQGTALSGLTAAGIYQIEQVPYKIRPNATIADGSTDLDITLVASSTVRR